MSTKIMYDSLAQADGSYPFDPRNGNYRWKKLIQIDEHTEASLLNGGRVINKEFKILEPASYTLSDMLRVWRETRAQIADPAPSGVVAVYRHDDNLYLIEKL